MSPLPASTATVPFLRTSGWDVEGMPVDPGPDVAVPVAAARELSVAVRSGPRPEPVHDPARRAMTAPAVAAALEIVRCMELIPSRGPGATRHMDQSSSGKTATDQGKESLGRSRGR